MQLHVHVNLHFTKCDMHVHEVTTPTSYDDHKKRGTIMVATEVSCPR